MTALITSGATVVEPSALSSYSADQEGGTIVHPILGGGRDITLRPVNPRTGSMTLDFPTEDDGSTARETLSAAKVWTLDHSERPSVGMRFIVRRLSQLIDGGGRWALTVAWEEVP